MIRKEKYIYTRRGGITRNLKKYGSNGWNNLEHLDMTEVERKKRRKCRMNVRNVWGKGREGGELER